MEMGIEERCEGRRIPVQERNDEELRNTVHCTTRHITTQLAAIITASQNINHDDEKTHLSRGPPHFAEATSKTMLQHARTSSVPDC